MDDDSVTSEKVVVSATSAGKVEKVPSPWTLFPKRISRRKARRQATYPRPDFLSMPISRERKDIISRRDHVVKVDRDQIYRVTQYHHKYTYYGTTLSGLTKFDDCTDYDISEDAEQSLLRIEVDRLANAAESEDPWLFDAKGLLKPTSDEGYDELAHLADQIGCNMEIIRLDNARISLEHCEGASDESAEVFRTARRRLRGRFKHEQTHVQGAEPKILDPPDRNQFLYFALVDYITACIARQIVRTAQSSYWHHSTLSTLASFAVKLKVLSHDPARYANFSIDTAEHAVEQMNQGFASKQATFIKVRVVSADDAKASDFKDVETLDSETDVSTRYYQEKTFFRKQLRTLVKLAMDNIVQDKDNRSSSGCFEASSVIARCGIDGALNTVASNRMGEIAASSDPFRIKCTFTALELTMKNVFRVKADIDAAPPQTPTVDDQRTHIKWDWRPGDTGISKDEIATASLEHVISFLVPFSLGITYATDCLDSLVSLAGSGTADDDPIRQFSPPSPSVHASIALTTAKWMERDSVFHDDEIQHLPNSPIRFGVRAGTKDLRKYSEKYRDAEASTDAKTNKVLRVYELDKRQMDTWEMSEDAVTIQCKTYVRVIMSIAALVVCSGMSVPFAVGTRIRGVDPFQITTFAWLLAGFLAIFAKSRYVSEWPWHDFMHGHVVCRSVKDVCDVTGVDPQMVLMYLLLEEQVTPLRTKGPYNGMFTRRSEDSSGFSIDEPAHISTMLASGFIILKILNEFGEHLICMDVRKGTKGEAPWLHNEREYLACMDLDNEVDYRLLNETGPPSSSAGDKRPTSKTKRIAMAKEHEVIDKVKKLKKQKVRINKVLGLYVANARFG